MAAHPVQPWPPDLAGTPAAAVIDQAIARQRLGHSLLLHGDSLRTLEAAASAIAERLLAQGGTPRPAGANPDRFDLRPTGKMRQISADATRELISQVQVTASLGSGKVAIIHEADRMNLSAANIFLKTLEEPPRRTTLILITTHPYVLLPTIRSRCLHFRFPGSANLFTDAETAPATEETADAPAGPSTAKRWESWVEDYIDWLGQIPEAAADKRSVSGNILAIYGLITRFGLIQDRAASEAWARQKSSLPQDLDDDEEVAIETGILKGLRAGFFTAIEEATRTHARKLLKAGTLDRRAFAAAVEQLEHNVRLFNVNMNESAALEDFLLASLRLWSGR